MAPVPIPEEVDEYTKSKSLYGRGSSKNTFGGLVVVYPDPGLVISTEIIFPLEIEATPTNSNGASNASVDTPTLTLVWIPDLYPEPL